MELNFKTFGKGRPIVFLHGLFGMLDNWQTFGKRMAEQDFMVYLVDQRDHGKSSFSDTFDYPTLAHDLYEFMAEQWLHQAIIVGHSMGGKVALQFVAEYPDMVDKLIIVDMGIKGYKGGHELIFDALRQIDLTKVDDRKVVAQHLYDHLDEDEDTIQFLLKNLSRNKEGGFRWKMNVENLYNHYNRILEPISLPIVDVPTLFVRGANSPYILDEDWPIIQASFRDAKLETIADAGHWVHAQQPNALYEVMMDFLAGSNN